MKDSLNNLSFKVKCNLLSKIDSYYKIEKAHTIVVIPFYGLLHMLGNEPRPILSFADLNTLSIISDSQFKDVYVYPGENSDLIGYNLSTLESTKHMATEQFILSKILNNPTSFKTITQEHYKILGEYRDALINFREFSKKYPLPYKTAFDIESPQDLITFIDKIYKQSKETDDLTRICLLISANNLQENEKNRYSQIKNYINSINGTLYLAQNQGHRYIHSIGYNFLLEDQFQEPTVHSIQDFAKVYSRQVSEDAKKAFDINNLYKQIISGELGSSENEIIENIEHINVQEIYKKYNLPKSENGKLITL